MSPVRFHDLRHIFGARMAAQGVPMRALQEMMGHRDFAREGNTSEADLPESSPEKIVLRVFFHAHGKRLVLLLSGYDKGNRPSTRRQQREIERARGYLKEWQTMQAQKQRRTSGTSAKDRRAGRKRR